MKLVSHKDPILKQTATDWIFDLDNLNYDQHSDQLEQELLSLMIANNGRGLAANQIGLLKRVFVIKLENGDQFAMFNPTLISSSDKMLSDYEGCLSFPNLFLEVKRSQCINVEYFNKDGELCKNKLEGIDARCFLHELDHLNGVCFTEKVSKLKLTMAKKKQRKIHG